MPNTQFPILGTAIPPMLGRGAILQKMMGALTKATPDHLQVVGPRFAGKTVLLHELAARLRQAGAPYSAVLLWDLGHQTPGTDGLFMQRLASELSAALRGSHTDYADHLKASEGNPFQDIAEVLDLLKEEGVKVLVIMDGFDKPLSNGQLTRNLWDQLRELALKPSLRLVTASRRTLRDLIRNPEAQTSDFWNIFEPNPVRVGCFDKNDLAAVLEKIPEWNLAAGAQTELWNASNGFPVLMLGVLNAVCESGQPRDVSPATMLDACHRVFPTIYDRLDALWSDCLPSAQDLLRRALDEGAIARTGLAVSDVDMLAERGFVHVSANKLGRPCRLLERYLGEQPHEGSALVRLFGTDDGYRKNLKEVLERRIGQIPGIDLTLKHYLERGTGDLPGHPDVFLTNIRGIVDRAFELIWEAELAERRVPSGWISSWEFNNEGGVDKFKTNFPKGVHRVRLLNLMTGTEKSEACAAHVTRGTYVLANATHAFGDFGQHQDGASIDLGMAYGALHLCIELAAALARELPVRA